MTEHLDMTRAICAAVEVPVVADIDTGYGNAVNVAFCRGWSGRAPAVIVPTAYPELTEDDIIALKQIKMVIYGNHAIRAAVTAMAEVSARIRADGGIHNVDRDIVPVSRIFELQRVAEMKEKEKRYLK